MIKDLLVYYGNGESTFGPFVEKYLAAVASGASSPLTEIMSREGSDKGTWHSYPLFYDLLFQNLPAPPKSIFEIGLGTNNVDVVGNMGPDGVPGASHRAWRSFYPGAEIYGADYDTQILFDESHIKTFYIDQHDPESIRRAWSLMPHLRFDIVIDDGAHTFEASSSTLDETYARVNPGGIYVVEDVVMALENLGRFDGYLRSRGWDAFLMRLPHDTNLVDNAVVVVRPNPPARVLTADESKAIVEPPAPPEETASSENALSLD